MFYLTNQTNNRLYIEKKMPIKVLLHSGSGSKTKLSHNFQSPIPLPPKIRAQKLFYQPLSK